LYSARDSCFQSDRRSLRISCLLKKDVQSNVQNNDANSQDDLHLARQIRGIDQRNEIMIDEASGIGLPASSFTKPIFPRSQGANPTGQLYDRSPNHGRNMNPDDPAPLESEQRSEENEQDVGQVEEKDGVGEELIDYRISFGSTPIFFACSRSILRPITMRCTWLVPS